MTLTQEQLVARRKKSLKYYYKNKEKCIKLVAEWTKKNKHKQRQYCLKSYYKKKHNREVFFIELKNIIRP
tara:strand:+ start:92 stop:301 length:210 start_codon:yes stop_codon:yes gene_type:complete